MYDYLKKNYLSSNFGGIQTEILCDIDLAQAIYTKIKNSYPRMMKMLSNFLNMH